MNIKKKIVINMFESKFTIFIVCILILCIALVSYAIIFDNFPETQSDLNIDSEEVTYIWMEDDNGNLRLIPTTSTHGEIWATGS